MVHLNNKTTCFTENAAVSIKRKSAVLFDMSPCLDKNVDNNFKQFASAYTTRLTQFSKDLVKKAKEKWGKPVLPLAELEKSNRQCCIIVGTLYKHQQWKPSILREICEEDQLILSEPKTTYCSNEDQLFLEDETARIRLIGDKLNMDGLVTGVVAAFLGTENENSRFEVQDVCFPGCPLQTKIRSKTSGKLVLLSGLNLLNSFDKLSTTLLTEWLAELSGDKATQEENANVVQVIIAGNGLSNDRKQTDQLTNYNSSSANNVDLIKNLQKLDEFISNLAENCYVTFMPGDGDATSIMMPQKRLHPCLLPKSRTYDSFTRGTNPWVCKIGTRVITGNCGQPIQDIYKACGGGSHLHCLEQTLHWRHLCPTCPDTLPSYPSFEIDDVLAMKECPDIYFAGNMPEFETKLWKGEQGQKVRLICVPTFSTCQAAVIVDLENLDVQVMTFGSN